MRRIEADADAAQAGPQKHAVVVMGDLNIRWEDGEWRTRGAHEVVWTRTFGRLIHVVGRTPTRFDASSGTLSQIDHVFVGLPRSVFVRIRLQTRADDPQAAHAANVSDHSAVRLLIGGALDVPAQRRPLHRDVVRSDRYGSVLAELRRDLPDAWSDPVYRWRSQKVMLRAAAMICMCSEDAPMFDGAKKEWELRTLARGDVGA